VDTNAMTFVPIGWNVVSWGVKSRLEHGQVIREDGGAEQLGEANAAQASRNPEAAKEEPEPAALGAVQEGYQRKRRMKPRNKRPNFRGGTPDALIHDGVNPRVTLCKVMGRYGL
jgi:hypothetical protein